MVVAASEVRPRTAGDVEALARATRRAEHGGRVTIEAVTFKPNRGRDFSSLVTNLARISPLARPDDWLLVLNRSAWGPLRDGWYGAFVAQHARHPGVRLCGATINLTDLSGRVPVPPAPHVQSHCFLTTVATLATLLPDFPGRESTTREAAINDGEIALSRRILERGGAITSLAWPAHCFRIGALEAPDLPARNIGASVPGLPFRHRRGGDRWRAWVARWWL